MSKAAYNVERDYTAFQEMGSNVAKSSLAVNTLRYWSFSRCWNGKVPEGGTIYTVGEANKLANAVFREVPPAHRLLQKMYDIHFEFLQHSRKPKPKKSQQRERVEITVL